METVRMVIPAAPSYLQVLRLVAAGLASRLAFTIDEIEDLKIGVDELSAYLTGAHGRDGSLDIAFRIDGSSITITGSGKFATDEKVRTELTDFSKMILETVADSASLAQTDGVPTFTLTKSRQLAEPLPAGE